MAEQGAADRARTQRRQHGNQLLQALLQSVQVDTQFFARKRCHEPCLQDSGCLTALLTQAAVTAQADVDLCRARASQSPLHKRAAKTVHHFPVSSEWEHS